MRRGLILFVVVVLGWVMSLAAAGYKESYKSAFDAIENDKWSEAESLLQQAVGDNPDAGGRVKLYGTRFVSYVPYYYLGLVRFNQGKCEGALQAWATAEQQGAIGKSERKVMEPKRAECQQQLPKATAPPTATARPVPSPTPTIDVDRLRRLDLAKRTAEQAINDAAEAEAAAAQKRGDGAFAAVWKHDPSLADSIDQASGKLRQARQRLARGDVDSLGQAASLAGEAQKEFVKASTDANDRLQVIEAALGAAEAKRRAQRRSLTALLERLGPARLALALEGPLSVAGKQSVSRERRALEQAIDAAAAAPNQSSLTAAQIEAIRGRLNQASSAFRQTVSTRLADEQAPTPAPVLPATPTAPPVSGGPPDGDPLTPLRSATGAFLAADYGRAVSELDEIKIEQTRARALAHLVRAAARYYLFVEGGSGEASLEAAAREDVRTCRTTDPGLEPDDDLFSPDFVSFFTAS